MKFQANSLDNIYNLYMVYNTSKYHSTLTTFHDINKHFVFALDKRPHLCDIIHDIIDIHSRYPRYHSRYNYQHKFKVTASMKRFLSTIALGGPVLVANV